MRLLQTKPANPLHGADDRHQLKFDWRPSAPLALLEDKLLILKFNASHRIEWVHINCKCLSCRRRASAERISRSNKIARHAIVLYFYLNDFSAFDRPRYGGRVVGVESECTVGPAQV